MLEQSKQIEKKPVKSPINTSKLVQAIDLSIELNKMVAEPTYELDIEALLAEPSEFIRKSEYSENLLDDLLNNDDLLDDFQDESAAVVTIGIIPFKFANQDSNLWYLEGDVMVEEAECASLILAEPEEIRFKRWAQLGHLRPLYIKAHINGKPVSRVLIDKGAVLNVMPFSTIKKLGKAGKILKRLT